MAYKSYGTSRGFRPLQAGQQALNQQLRKDEQVISNLKSVRDQNVQRDSELIQGLRRKFNQEDTNRQANERLEDKKYVQRKQAIEANANRTRQNLQTDLKNIEREAEVWKTFSETAYETLTTYAEQRKKQQEIEDYNTYAETWELKDETSLSDTVIKKLRENKWKITKGVLDLGGDGSIVAALSADTPQLKRYGEATAAIQLNKHGYEDYANDFLIKTGATTEEEIEKDLKAARYFFGLEIGVKDHVKLQATEGLIKHATDVNRKILTKHKTEINFRIGQQNKSNTRRDLELKGRGGTTEDHQHYLNNYLSAWQTAHDEEGDVGGMLGVKSGLKALLSDPKYIRNDADEAEFLNMRSLANTKGDKITRPALKINEVLTPVEIEEAAEKRIDKQLEDDKRTTAQNKAHQNKLFELGKKTFVENWDGSPDQKHKILRGLRTAHATEDTIKKLDPFFNHSDKNADLQLQKDNADLLIEQGKFFEADYLALPPSLRNDPKYKQTYITMQKLVDQAGWDESTINKTAKNTIINDVIKLKGLTIDSTYNGTIDLAITEATNDFYKRFKEKHITEGIPAVKAKKEAWGEIATEVKSGEGKWRVNTGYTGADRTTGVNHFPYFNGDADTDYMIEYPLAHVEQLIEKEGATVLQTTQVISNADLKEQIANVNKGGAWEISQDVQDLSDVSGLGVSEILNNNLELAGLKDQVKIKPSIKETTMEKVKATGDGNLVNFTKNLKTIDDAFKARIASVEPRLPSAMTGTTKFNSINVGTGQSMYMLPERLRLTPQGEAIFQNYLAQGRPRNGARIVKRRPMKGGGFGITVQLPIQEPKYLFLFDGGN